MKMTWHALHTYVMQFAFTSSMKMMKIFCMKYLRDTPQKLLSIELGLHVGDYKRVKQSSILETFYWTDMYNPENS